MKQEITEIENYAARLSNTVGGAAAALLGPEILGDTTRKQFITAMPPDKRRSREALSAIVNTYFTGLENNHGDEVPNFADDCLRIENGSQTTGRPVTGDAKPGALNYGCKEAFSLGYYRDDTRLRNRRILLSVPYGMRPAFSTGVHMPSPQAQKDGFKEY